MKKAPFPDWMAILYLPAMLVIVFLIVFAIGGVLKLLGVV